MYKKGKKKKISIIKRIPTAERDKRNQTQLGLVLVERSLGEFKKSAVISV